MQILIVALVLVCASGFRVSQQRRAGIATKQHALVEKFSLLDGREVRVFDGAYDVEVCAEVSSTSAAAIAAKGSFSLCIPGGSVVSALKGLDTKLDFSKWHIYFANERIGANKCYEGALKAFVTSCNIPLSQVHGVGEQLGCSPAEVAARYEAKMRGDASVGTAANGMPSVDMLLLGTGDDGHCGSLYPNSKEIMMTGSGKAVLGVDEGDKKSIAVSMDFMNAAKRVIVSAAEPKRAEMVHKALTKTFPRFGSPSGLVDAEQTVWFTDNDSFAQAKGKVAKA